MIKLTYASPDDPFRTVTVLGNEAGILDLWFRMTQARFEHPSHGFGAIGITNLDGAPIDPRQGLDALCAIGTDLGQRQR